ncbi:MAG: hypothetical protein EOP86_15285 [Verrucomicrobiaceae bacterium]|nr:MAG: hypothetical protein EOP86_15285 [Verrucomicrobiaceae bacterium]
MWQTEFESLRTLKGGKGRFKPPPGIRRAACWAHVRRKFFEAAKAGCPIGRPAAQNHQRALPHRNGGPRQRPQPGGARPSAPATCPPRHPGTAPAMLEAPLPFRAAKASSGDVMAVVSSPAYGRGSICGTAGGSGLGRSISARMGVSGKPARTGAVLSVGLV